LKKTRNIDKFVTPFFLPLLKGCALPFVSIMIHVTIFEFPNNTIQDTVKFLINAPPLIKAPQAF
jgi:hypothetical protein